GIRAFEEARTRLAAAPARLSYFEESWELFDELLGLRVRESRYDDALELLINSRGLVLQEETRSRISPEKLARSLPPHTAVLGFGVLERSVIAWTLTNGEI